MSALTVTSKDNQKDIELNLGDTLLVLLEENATTGFRWDIENKPQFLDVERSDYEESQSSLIGAAKTRRFEFKSTTRGAAKLGLKRWRHWEGESSIKERFTLNVSVR